MPPMSEGWRLEDVDTDGAILGQRVLFEHTTTLTRRSALELVGVPAMRGEMDDESVLSLTYVTVVSAASRRQTGGGRTSGHAHSRSSCSFHLMLHPPRYTISMKISRNASAVLTWERRERADAHAGEAPSGRCARTDRERKQGERYLGSARHLHERRARQERENSARLVREEVAR
jgi:hypothetical protein